MKKTEYKTYKAIVVGSGAAGYNAACRLISEGVTDICIVTEGKDLGTSRNTGSDKQTYYKLGLGGSASDSVRQMAEDLFAGGCVDGDNALCEAALSARCFFNLCEAGVPFPSGRYGEYIGYKTDHDPYERATSAGPLTSKFMTEALERKVRQLSVEVYDGLIAIEVITSNGKVCGLLCLDKKSGNFKAFRCPNVILATGGPAGIYSDSVYPECQTGSTSLALNAGASLQNLTEWQYGIASLSPRWNVSGTYMQVLPRFVSVDENGREYEFLSDFFSDKYEALSMVFLKGYQWPFDIKKAYNGSSVIDLLVYRETVINKCKVYLDFTKNPFGLDSIEYKKLNREAYSYLKKADALFGKPIDRLKKMNSPAIELYRSKGVNIENEYLEIALCAQHNNGGISVDKWWQTSICGLFAAGECAGTHGITRPGGRALNAGQVGSLRAAQYIAAKDLPPADERLFDPVLSSAIDKHLEIQKDALRNTDNADARIDLTRERMSSCGGPIRDIELMKKAYAELWEELEGFSRIFGVKGKSDLYKIYRLRDTLTVQLSVLYSMIDYAEKVGTSRGSALYRDHNGKLRDRLPEIFRFSFDEAELNRGKIQEISNIDGKFKAVWREVRPLPEDEDIFEKVWERYRADRNVY